MKSLPHPVCLIGLPGVGKSTIGWRLADRLGVSFFDTDRSVEEEVQCSIAELFVRQGEAEFRELEARALERLLAVSPAGIIATGGGIVTHAASRALLANRSIAIYLKAGPQDLARRLRRDTKRPLLQGGDVLATLRRLDLQRDPLYRAAASFTIEATQMSVSAAVSCIEIWLQRSESNPCDDISSA